MHDEKELLSLYWLDINAPEIAIRHVLIFLQVLEIILDISTTDLQNHMLCSIYYFADK